MRGADVRRLSAFQVKDWYATEKPIPSAPLSAESWKLEDPLGTMTNLVSNGVGTWDVSTGVLRMISSPSNSLVHIRHTYPIPVSEQHIHQVDIRIPTGIGGAQVVMGVGFNTLVFGENVYAEIEYYLTEHTAWAKPSGAGWIKGPDRDFNEGQWYTMKIIWNILTSIWSLYIDGVFVNTYSATQSGSGLYPALMFYSVSSVANVSFRNMKYWGGPATAAPPN